jgi:hypothetical protein
MQELRDYLAGQALPAVIAKYPNTDFIGASELAYQYADAMLLIRVINPANYGDEV